MACTGDRNFSRCSVCGATFENQNETLTRCWKHRRSVKRTVVVMSGWEPVPGPKPWTVRFPDGRVLRRFATLTAMQAWLDKWEKS